MPHSTRYRKHASGSKDLYDRQRDQFSAVLVCQEDRLEEAEQDWIAAMEQYGRYAGIINRAGVPDDAAEANRLPPDWADDDRSPFRTVNRHIGRLTQAREKVELETSVSSAGLAWLLRRTEELDSISDKELLQRYKYRDEENENLALQMEEEHFQLSHHGRRGAADADTEPDSGTDDSASKLTTEASALTPKTPVPVRGRRVE